MREAWRSLPKIIAHTFTGRRLWWQIFAWGITFALVSSGLDWNYFQYMGRVSWDKALYPAVVLGALVPIVWPLGWIFYGHITHNRRTIRRAWVLGSAIVAAVTLVTAYKAFTGRLGPNLLDLSTDISRDFHFGFWRNGVFWGWPSGHTAVAFAMAPVLSKLFPRPKLVGRLAWLYAFYIGLGVTGSIHWLSEFIAGAIVGTLVGQSTVREDSRRMS
jgi:membrane-associated phospholipid phosphatase